MQSNRLRILVVVVPSISCLVVAELRGQDACLTYPDSMALADTLLAKAGRLVEGQDPKEISLAWREVRRAVEVAPLNHDRLAFILQLSRFLNRPDSAIALANLARQRWSECTMSDSALVQAKALPPERR